MSDIKRYVYIEMTDEQYQEQSAVLWNLKKVGQRICNADIEKAYQDKIDSLITTIESQKEEIEDIKRHQGEYIASLEFDVESLKAITELAVKGLKEVLEDAPWETVSYGVAFEALREIERIQNE